jgi:hypothetical protein
MLRYLNHGTGTQTLVFIEKHYHIISKGICILGYLAPARGGFSLNFFIILPDLLRNNKEK